MHFTTFNLISQLSAFFFWVLITHNHPMHGRAHLCQSLTCSLEMTALTVGLFVQGTLLVQRFIEWMILLLVSIEEDDQLEENDDSEEDSDSEDQNEGASDDEDDSDYQPEEDEATEEDDSYEIGSINPTPDRTPELQKAVEHELRNRNLIPSKKED